MSVTLRSFAVRASAAALLLIAAAAATPGPAAAETLRVMKSNAVAFSFVPLEVGLAAGIFKKHGVDLEVTSAPGSAKMQQALAADGADIGLGSGPELAFVAKGAPVLGVAAMAREPRLLCLVVLKDSPINSVAELKGKSISVSTVGSLTQWLVRELSRQQGWGPEGIKAVALGANPTQLAALRTHQVDAWVTEVAGAYQLEEDGVARIIYRFGDLTKDFIIHVIFARKDLIESKPELLRHFLAAWFETIEYMRDHKAETVKVATPVMNVTAEIAARTYDELMPMFSDDGRFEPKALKVLADSFVELGTLPSVPDMSKLYTEAFLPGAGH